MELPQLGAATSSLVDALQAQQQAAGSDPWPLVGKVVFINLDRRQDRKESMLRLLQHLPPEKVVRLSAREPPEGFPPEVGCTMSHIAALELAQAGGWSSVLVMEDDCAWGDEHDTRPERPTRGQREELFRRLAAHGRYDVVLAGSGKTTYYARDYLVVTAQAAHAYLVSRDYYSTLLANFRDGLELMMQAVREMPDVRRPGKYCLDQYWKRLQGRGSRWFVVTPSLFVQTPGKSDIEGKHTDYTKACRAHVPIEDDRPVEPHDDGMSTAEPGAERGFTCLPCTEKAAR